MQVVYDACEIDVVKRTRLVDRLRTHVQVHRLPYRRLDSSVP